MQLLSNLASLAMPSSTGGSLSSLAGDPTSVGRPGFFQSGGTGQSLLHRIGQALYVAGGGDPVADDERRAEIGTKQQLAQASLFKALQGPEPHYFEANNGDQFRVGGDGQPQLVYKDPTPKTTYITADNGDGTKSLIPVVNGVPQMGGSGGAAPPPQPSINQGFADLPSGFTIRKGGAANTGGTFPRSVSGAR